MKNKLAGHLPLQEAIAKTLEDARAKMKLAAENCDDEKTKKLLKYEKKEHGHTPSVEEEKAEKKASVINPADPDEVEKLALALDSAAEKLASDVLGGEKPQGGMVLEVQKPSPGTQPYKKDSSKSHNVPNSTGMIAAKDAAKSNKTVVPTDDNRAPGGTGAKFPAKGVLKTGAAALKEEVAKVAWAVTDEGHKLDAKRYNASSKSEHEKGKAEDEYAKEAPVKAMMFRGMMGAAHKINSRHTDYAAKKHEKGHNAYNPFGGLLTKSRHEKAEKKASAQDPVNYILGKIAASQKTATVENGGESRQGGEQLSNTAPVPSNPGRNLIRNAQGIKDVTKREAKAPRKKELSEVLTEPAFSAAHDSKVNENLAKANKGGVSKISHDLRSATKGGVKTAAARAFLQKIAEEGCKCDGAGNCRHCKMTEKVAHIKKAAGSEASSATA